LSAFVLAVLIHFGLWPTLMFIGVIKSSGIGAYACGTLFGRHRFSPKLSPGKTWEGMAGTVAAAITVAVLFSVICDIMEWWLAVVFGFAFAFIGQMGDLAESMMKRDAEQKDSANKVPGFGGLLDIIDSVLVSAPFAYLFFLISDGTGILFLAHETGS
jgi:phosphatidate cytidylyltransferase